MLRKKRFLFLCIPCFVFGLSCSKNKYVSENDKASAHALLSLSGFSDYKLSRLSGTDNIKLSVVVPIASNLKRDASVKMEIDTSLLGDYNRKAFSNYTLPPDGMYSLSGDAITIPSGDYKVAAPLSVNAGSWLTNSSQYAIPIRLLQVGNFPLDPKRSSVILRLRPFTN